MEELKLQRVQTSDLGGGVGARYYLAGQLLPYCCTEGRFVFNFCVLISMIGGLWPSCAYGHVRTPDDTSMLFVVFESSLQKNFPSIYIDSYPLNNISSGLFCGIREQLPKEQYSTLENFHFNRRLFDINLSWHPLKQIHDIYVLLFKLPYYTTDSPSLKRGVTECCSCFDQKCFLCTLFVLIFVIKYCVSHYLHVFHINSYFLTEQFQSQYHCIYYVMNKQQ